MVEPDAPGADEIVVSLYHTIDSEKLATHRDEVKALFARNAAAAGPGSPVYRIGRQPDAGQPPGRGLQRQL